MYNVDRLKQQAAMFKKAGVVTLCIFKSTPSSISKYSAASGCTDNPIALSDKKGSVFKSFMIKKSTWAAIGGSMDIVSNWGKYKPKVFNALKDTRYGTNLNQLRQLPADFMINEDGVIVDLLRAEKMSDYMPFERVEKFIPEERRCKCNKKDCIVSIYRSSMLEVKKHKHLTKLLTLTYFFHIVANHRYQDAERCTN